METHRKDVKNLLYNRRQPMMMMMMMITSEFTQCRKLMLYKLTIETKFRFQVLHVRIVIMSKPEQTAVV